MGNVLKSRMFYLLLLKALTVRKSRAFIALFSIAVGAAIVTSLASLYFDISIKMSKELRTYGANFFVGPAVDSENRDLVRETFLQVKDAVPPERLAGSTPYLYGVVRLDLDNAVMAGVEFTGLKRIAPYWQLEGQWIGVDFDDKHCMIGSGLAQKMELKVGDEVNLVNRDQGFRTKLRVKGILDTGEAADDYIFVNLALAQQALGRPGRVDHAMFSILAEGFNIDAFAASLEAGHPGLDAKPIRKIAESEGRILDKIKALMALVATIILVITTLCVNTTLTAMVVERTPEIGLQKALGADNRVVVLQFLAETLLIGLAGVVIGLASGFLLAQVLGQAVFGSSVSFRPVVLPLAIGISVAAALAAAAIPTRRAVQVAPAQVLRGE